MANRSVSVRLRADIAQFKSAMSDAAESTKQIGDAARSTEKASGSTLSRLTQHAQQNRQAWDDVSSGLLKVGTVGVAGLAGVTKAAMDWESSWAGVTKTVEGTPQQLSAVENGLRGLAKELPASHQQIAAVAEAAGQLGIATPDVVNFTRTMIDLGETTNLSAEEAATSLARFMNIMGTSHSDVSRLGSTLVELGNNFATTEAEIMAMSMRLAGTGQQIGMTEAEVMGLAAAMSSVGVEAEAGGTAMSMTMTRINDSVSSGSDKLEQFADIAGTSAEDFANKWRENPAAAMDSFVQGLSRVQESGGNVSGTLDELGIKGIRERDTLLRLAGASDLLGQAFESSNSAFEQNAALAAEAAKRYETTESQVRIAWNGIKDAAIDAGAVMLPVVENIAKTAAGLAEAFNGLPAPVQGSIVAIGGIAAVAALAVGGGMKLVTMAADASEAMTALGISTDGVKGKLSGVGKVAAVAAAAFAGFELAKWAGAQGQPAIATLEQIGTTIRNTSDGALDLNRAFQSMADGAVGSGREIKGLDDAMQLVHGDSFADKMLRVGDSMGVENEVAHAKAAFEGIDATLAQMASSGSIEQAAEGFRQVAEAAKANGMDIEEVARSSFPAYMDALQQLGNSYDYPLEGAELMAAAAGDLPPALVEAMGGAEGAAAAMEGLGGAAEETAESLSSIVDSLFQLGEMNMTAAEATAAFHEAQRGLAEALAANGAALDETGEKFDVTTEAGAAAQEAFNGLTRSGIEMAEAMAANGASMGEIQGALQGTYDSLVSTATQFGYTGEQADQLARYTLGIPDNVSIESWMSDQAKAIAEATGQSVDSIPDSATVQAFMNDAAFVEALRTRAAVLNIPESDAVDSFMSSYAADKADETTAKILGIPEGASVSSWMSSSARSEADALRDAINRVDGRHSSSSHTHTITTVRRAVGGAAGGPIGAMLAGGKAMGGRAPSLAGIPAAASGMRLPLTGPGTDTVDGFLGVASNGMPRVRVDAGEWITNRRSSDKYNGLLSLINADHPSVHHLKGYAGGGRAEYAPSPVAYQTATTATVDAPSIDYDRLAQAMTSVQILSPVNIGRREAARVVQVGKESLRGR